MKYLLVPLLLFGIGCGTMGDRVEFKVKNRTEHPLVVTLRAGILSKTIRLKPNRTWSGYGFKSLVPKEIYVEVDDE